jgi:hypothetical protein
MPTNLNPSTPPRRTAQLEPACEFCGTRCTGAAPGDWRQVVGWVQTRRAGGAHSINSPEPTGRAACEDCMAALRLGVDPTAEPQAELFS